MTCNFLDLGGASDWLKQISLGARPIRSTTQSLEVTAIWSALVPQYSPFFSPSPSPLKYMNSCLHGKRLKRRNKKGILDNLGDWGLAFVRYLRVLWSLGEHVIYERSVIFSSLCVISDATLSFQNPQAIQQYNTQSPDFSRDEGAYSL